MAAETERARSQDIPDDSEGLKERIVLHLERLEGNKDERIFLRADRTVDYGTLMGVMDKLRSAGYLKVALVNLQGQKEGSEAGSTPVPSGNAAKRLTSR
ncbi:biopolymer transporter ExbD [Acetobacter fabarum]|uniref:biopolymer transporter ExbD n=1 Tax=Acetobacter fabarum TaxID=483199 RepID=UPI00319DFBCC